MNHLRPSALGGYPIQIFLYPDIVKLVTHYGQQLPIHDDQTLIVGEMDGLGYTFQREPGHASLTIRWKEGGEAHSAGET